MFRMKSTVVAAAAPVFVLVSCSTGDVERCDLDRVRPSLIVELSSAEASSPAFTAFQVGQPYKIGISDEADGDVVYACNGVEQVPSVVGENSTWRGESSSESLQKLGWCGEGTFVFSSDPQDPILTVSTDEAIGGGKFEPEYVSYDFDEDAPKACETGKTSTVVIDVFLPVDNAIPKAFTVPCDVADIDYDEDLAEERCVYPEEDSSQDTAYEMFADLQLAALGQMSQSEIENLMIWQGWPGYRPEVMFLDISCGGLTKECGSSVMTGNTLMTAGHCLDHCGPSGLLIPAGSGNFIRVTGKTSSTQTLPYTQTYSGDFRALIHSSHVSNNGDANNDVGVIVLNSRMSSYYRARYYSSYTTPPSHYNWEHYGWGFIDSAIPVGNGQLEYADMDMYNPGGWTSTANYTPNNISYPIPGDSGGPIGFMSQGSSTGPNYSERYVIVGPMATSSTTWPWIGDTQAERMPEIWMWLDSTAGPALSCTFNTGCSASTSYGYPIRRCLTDITCP